MLSSLQRRRAFGALFTGVAVSTTGFLASNTVNGLIAEDLTGTTTWSGLPAAASVLGTAAGATALAAVVRRSGPRTGLTIGYAVATVATLAASVAISSRGFVAFVVSMFVFGLGFGSNRLARYVAADLYPPEQRATMIGWIVWAATIGAVAGPALLAPSRDAADIVGINGLIGPYLVCAIACVLSTGAMLTAPRAMDAPPLRGRTDARLVPLSTLLRDPGVTLALTSMVSGQFVMVLLMTMTPLHIRHEGHGLGAIGLVISAHTLGMYALSPLTGRMGDRVGRIPLLVAGVATLVLAGFVGMTAGGSYPQLLASLLLLGIGWNLGFVGGSALLTDSVTPAERVRVQGLGDALVWGGGALASIGSGWMLEHSGFAMLSGLGSLLALAPVAALVRYRRSARPRVATAA
ncbi:MAG TPA: MFS transporter [Vicinamibacterales bacterium]|nr:MFS transporter [Vicinamibacterales bacterium]